MKCFECSKGRLIDQETEIMGEIRGEQVPTRTRAMVCNRCGAQVLTGEQSKAYTIASADAYRRKHGLLTSGELTQIRDRLNFSQQAFAQFLKVGIASVKRWEAGLVQDEAMDELIRIKTNLETARGNVEKLEELLGVRPTSTRTEVQYVVVPIRPRKRAEWEQEPLPALPVIASRDTSYTA